MEDLTPDEWDELMSEPPGGDNHGRRMTAGGWWSLEEDFAKSFQGGLTIEKFEPAPRPRSIKPDDVIRHGTLAAYQNDKCRCGLCRAAQREYMRQWRKENASDS